MVNRYELKADYDCGEMVPLIDGTYVLYSDYAKLEAKFLGTSLSHDIGDEIMDAYEARISELEAQVSAWQRWYDRWEFSNDYNLPDSPETEDQMK